MARRFASTDRVNYGSTVAGNSNTWTLGAWFDLSQALGGYIYQRRQSTTQDVNVYINATGQALVSVRGTSNWTYISNNLGVTTSTGYTGLVVTFDTGRSAGTHIQGYFRKPGGAITALTWGTNTDGSVRGDETAANVVLGNRFDFGDPFEGEIDVVAWDTTVRTVGEQRHFLYRPLDPWPGVELLAELRGDSPEPDRSPNGYSGTVTGTSVQRGGPYRRGVVAYGDTPIIIAGQRLVPGADTVLGGWTDEGGSTPVYPSLDEGRPFSAADYGKR